MAVDIDDKKLDGKGLSDLWGIIKQYVAQHGSGVVPATEDTLGGIMVGSTLSITNAGVLNLPTLVTASTFRSVSVDAYGRVVGGTNPTTLAGYGITDAKIENGVITLGGNTITPITSLSGYATQSWVQQQGYTTNIGTVTQVKIGSTAYNPSSGVISLPAYPTVPTKVSELTNDSGYTTNIGTVTQVKVGSTAYNPSSGVVSLPAYPTSLPASDVYSWAKASSKPSYTLDEVSDGSSRKLANYLPLSGGTLTNTLIIRTTNYNSFNEGIRIQDAPNGYAGITFGATGASGITPESGQVAWFLAKNSSSRFVILPDSSTESTGLVLTKDGDMKWRDNTVYHAGNLPAYPTKSSWNYDDRYLRIDTNNTYGGVMSFTTSGYGINVGGILGAFSNALLHLYERVNIGSPNGWGSQDAPQYGLSVYGGCSLATNTGSVGIATTSPETKLDVNGIQQIYQRGLDNTAFKNLLLLKAQNSTETGGDNWGDTYPTFGIGFRRYWTSGSNPYGETTCAGIYATISSSWRGGLVFRTKNNQNSGGTHDVTALRLAPSGAAIFSGNVSLGGTLSANSFSAFTIKRGTMNHTVANGSHLYYLSMSVSDARKCIFSYIMENAYEYQSGCYSYHAGNGLADTMGVKYVYYDTYNGTSVSYCWIVTTGSFYAGNVYYSYIIIN